MRCGILFVFLTLLTPSPARPHSSRLQADKPYANAYAARAKYSLSNSSLTIDLGYEVYQGVSNVATGINSWKGIRFAAPPTGPNRWQAPKIPYTNRSGVILADTYSTQCPQASNSDGIPFEEGITGNEDCLFLNVDAPAQPERLLPVLVWIHGGGYGQLDGRQDLTTIINANNNSFVGISIEYRV